MENQVIAYNVINKNVNSAAIDLMENVKTMLSMDGKVQEYSARSGGQYTADTESVTVKIDDKTTIMINVLRHK